MDDVVTRVGKLLVIVHYYFILALRAHCQLPWRIIAVFTQRILLRLWPK